MLRWLLDIALTAILANGEIRQRFLFIVKGKTPLSLEAKYSLFMIAPEVRTSETATRANLQVALGTSHVFHLPK